MQLILPKYEFNIRHKMDQAFIFDPVRRKYVALTPEEWVRQHWIRYLIEQKQFPRSLIAVEKELKVNQLPRRCDIVIYGRQGLPLMIVECKAGGVKLSQKAFDQIARYNLTLNVQYLVVSNGHKTYCCKINAAKQSYHFVESIPAADDLI